MPTSKHASKIDALVKTLDAPAEAVRLADISTSGSTQLKYTSNFTKKEFEEVVE